MIRFFTTIGGFLLGSLLLALIIVLSFNPNFFALKMLENNLSEFGVKPKNSLDKYLNEQLAKEMIASPETLTYLGFDSLNYLTNHNSRFDDNSIEAIYEQYLFNKSYLNSLNKVDPDELGNTKYSLDIQKFNLENKIISYQAFPFHFNPVSQFYGKHLRIIEFLTDSHKIVDERSIRDYLYRVSAASEVIENNINYLNERAQRGIFSPRFVYEKASRQLSNIISFEIQDNPIYFSLERRLNELEISQETKEKYLSDAKQRLEKDFYPSYAKLLKILQDQMNSSRKMDGVWGLPNGDDYYKHRLRIYTTTNYTPDEIHEIGLEMVDSIQKEIVKILASEGYDTSKNLIDLYEVLNDDKRFLFEDSDKGRQEILDRYTQIQNDALEKMRDHFHDLPNSEVIVKRIPTYAEESAAGGYYQSPSLDGKRPGIFYANLYDIKATKSFGMPALSFHEAIPGHHFQNALNQENKNQTVWKKFGYRTSAYGEGWALYAERLAIEIGLVADPYEMIGSLQSELFRAVRLVIDTGIHQKKWTREKAITYMMENVGSERSEATSEVERYIVWPGQACAYMLGRIKIMELRETSKKELGNNFNIKDFHREVLMNGSVPLTVLEAIIENYISSKKF